MPALVRIERSEGGDIAWNTRAIARIGVEECDRGWAEVDATGGIGTPTGKVHVELGLVLAYRVHVGLQLVVDARVVCGQEL